MVFVSSQICAGITTVDLKTFRTSERHFYLSPLSSHPPKDLLMYFLSLRVCLFWTISFIHKEIRSIFCQWLLSLSRVFRAQSYCSMYWCFPSYCGWMMLHCMAVCPVAQLCSTLCNPMDYSMPGILVLHHLPEFGQTDVHWVGEAVQPSHPLSFSSPPALNLSQHRGLFQWIGSSHPVTKVASFAYWSMDIWVVSTF